jgi:HSP20 family protein
MYESILNHPNSLFGQFERLRRELDDVFGVSGLPSSIRSVVSGARPAAWRSMRLPLGWTPPKSR